MRYIGKLVDFIGFFQIFKTIKNFEKFNEWMDNNHNDDYNSPNLKKTVYQGYHLFLALTWQKLIESLMDQDFLCLKDDKTYIRAFYKVGISKDNPPKVPENPLFNNRTILRNDIPITCEKSALIFGLIDLGKNLISANKPGKLKEALLKIEEFLNILGDFISSHIKTSDELDENLLKITSIYTLFTHYHNCQSQKPFVFDNIFYYDNFTKEYILNSISGFIFAIYYLWSNLIDKTDFQKYQLNLFDEFQKIVKSIFSSKEIYSIYLIYLKLKSNIKINDNDEESDSILENIMTAKNINKKNDKDAYNTFFMKNIDIIKKGEEMVDHFHPSFVDKIEESPLENIYFIQNLSPQFEFTDKISPDDLILANIWNMFDAFYGKFIPLVNLYENLLSYNDFRDEKFTIDTRIIKSHVKKYFKPYSNWYIDESIESEQELHRIMSAKLFWYKIEILEENSTYFNGVAAFNPLLVGTTILRKKYKNKDKIVVKVFKHPEHQKSTTGSISLGLLTELYGSAGSDLSGWLIFFNCARYGYSGFGPKLYNSASDIIEEYKNNIDLEEITISEDFFIKFLNIWKVKKILPLIDKNSKFEEMLPIMENLSKVQESRQQLKNSYNIIRGRYFESLIFIYFSQSGKTNLYMNSIVDKNEIDLYWQDQKTHTIEFYECKIDIHDYNNKFDEYIEKIHKRKSALLKKFPDYNIIEKIIIYQKIESKRKISLENNHLIVIDNFSKILQESRTIGDFKNIKSMLDTKFNEN